MNLDLNELYKAYNEAWTAWEKPIKDLEYERDHDLDFLLSKNQISKSLNLSTKKEKLKFLTS